VAQVPPPGAKAQYETGRSSPKLESWFCTPLSLEASSALSRSKPVTSAQRASTAARSSARRAAARRIESLQTQMRAARSACDPSV